MKVSILGSGSFGLAISSIFNDNNLDITIYTRTKQTKNELITNRVSPKLPNYRISKNIKITDNIKESVSDKDLIVIAIPVANITEVCIKIKDYINKNTTICIVSKGIEQKTGFFPYKIVKKILKANNISILSGPSFAKDIIAKKPIGFALASNSNKAKNITIKAFQNSYIKLRYTKDIIGVEICGAIKNIIAISAGILDGLNCGDSTRAMLITEALHDIQEIIFAFNGDKKTVLSFAGFGDLLLTCTSTTSRNYSFGYLIGNHKSNQEIETYLKENTVEGYYTLTSIYYLLKNKKVKIPIINLIYNIVNNKNKPESLLSFLIEKN